MMNWETEPRIWRGLAYVAFMNYDPPSNCKDKA